MTRFAIGMMSGTSFDGIDIILCEITEINGLTKYKILKSDTYPYDLTLRNRIEEAISDAGTTSRLICSLNYELAQAYSKCVFAFCEKHKINLDQIEFISNHGQTIYHINETDDDYTRSSLQLGDGSVLATLTNTTVVSNFRSADIAAYGKGAPLVPYADFVLFQDTLKTRAMQNIGGIANVTYLPKNQDLNEVIAFDNGPGNMMIDEAMKILFDKPYDESGKTAYVGRLIDPLFQEILEHPYFQMLPPKSTGREVFGKQYTEQLIHKYNDYSKEDIIATFTHVTAYAIADSYKRFLPKDIDEIIVSGGGAFNHTLMELIRYYTGNEAVYPLEKYGYDSSFKEALAFVILADETMHRRPSNVPSATGARRRVVLGSISWVNKQGDNR